MQITGDQLGNCVAWPNRNRVTTNKVVVWLYALQNRVMHWWTNATVYRVHDADELHAATQVIRDWDIIDGEHHRIACRDIHLRGTKGVTIRNIIWYQPPANDREAVPHMNEFVRVASASRRSP